MTLSAADRLAILDVITRADDAASRRDADGHAGLFTEDAVLDGTQGRHAGREALRSGVPGPAHRAEFPGSAGGGGPWRHREHPRPGPSAGPDSG